MSPDSEPTLAEVLDQLVKREPIFHRPEFGPREADFENWRSATKARRGGVGDHGFPVPKAGGGVYLLTYTLLQENHAKTRRSTIWQRTEEGWKIVYHQERWSRTQTALDYG